jgi:hypothetical protein
MVLPCRLMVLPCRLMVLPCRLMVLHCRPMVRWYFTVGSTVGDCRLMVFHCKMMILHSGLLMVLLYCTLSKGISLFTSLYFIKDVTSLYSRPSEERQRRIQKYIRVNTYE